MFGKFFRPRFEVNPALEPVVQEYANLHSRGTAMVIDREAFTPEEIEETKRRLTEIEETHGAELKTYLAPYAGYGKPPRQGKDEWARWFAAKALIQGS